MIVGSALERISRPNVLRPNVFAPKCPRAQMSAPKCFAPKCLRPNVGFRVVLLFFKLVCSKLQMSIAFP